MKNPSNKKNKHKPVKKECNHGVPIEYKEKCQYCSEIVLPKKPEQKKECCDGHAVFGRDNHSVECKSNPKQKEEEWKRKFIKAAKQTRYYKQKEETDKMECCAYKTPHGFMFNEEANKHIEKLLKKEKERMIKEIDTFIQYPPIARGTGAVCFDLDEWEKLKKQLV